MGEKKEYDPDVYKRLELVRKQFQNNAAEQKKQQSAERRQKIVSDVKQNKDKIARIVTYAILAAILIGIIVIIVINR